MRLEKVLLVIICLWGVLLAMAPVFGIEFYFPYIGKGGLDSAQQIERLSGFEVGCVYDHRIFHV